MVIGPFQLHPFYLVQYQFIGVRHSPLGVWGLFSHRHLSSEILQPVPIRYINLS